MSRFDPYEHLLRNFSKHKFKIFIENTLFKPDEAFKKHVSYYGTYYTNLWTVDKKNWGDSDVAHVDIPNVGMVGVYSFSRWIFFLDHLENDLIVPKMIWPRASQHLAKLAKSLAADHTYLKELREKLSIEHEWPMIVRLYYLTNATFDPSVGEDEFYNSTASSIRSIFLKGARESRLDYKKVDINFGIGNPTTFVKQARAKTVKAIKQIEARPDSIHLQFSEGQIEVIASNKRKTYAYDQKAPKLITLDQKVDSRLYFTADEVEEFASLLNKQELREEELQRFLSEHPKFL